jgi:methyltransferase
MTLQGRRLGVSLPDSVLEDKDSLRDKTAKLGLIARACAIYGVDFIEVFKDPMGHGEGQVIRRVLEYLETPQYLRKRLFPLDEALKYAGMLPPLRIPSHKPRVPFHSLQTGEVREGVVNGDGTVDIGLDVAPKLTERAKPDERITVRLSSTSPPIAKPIPREEAGGYWGYVVEAKSVQDVIADARFELKVATSKKGTPMVDVLKELGPALRRAKSVNLMFGSPSRGLFEIVGRDLASRVGFVVNLFPGQQVETVRTEEAIFVGLGIISLLSSDKA